MNERKQAERVQRALARELEREQIAAGQQPRTLRGWWYFLCYWSIFTDMVERWRWWRR